MKHTFCTGIVFLLFLFLMSLLYVCLKIQCSAKYCIFYWVLGPVKDDVPLLLVVFFNLLFLLFIALAAIWLWGLAGSISGRICKW